MKKLREEANGGDAVAMSWLCYAYSYSKHGLQKDYKQARMWFERGANLSDAICMAQSGDSLLNGWGGDTNFTLGVFYCTQAASKGLGLVAEVLGLGFAKGCIHCLSTMSRPGCGLRSAST